MYLCHHALKSSSSGSSVRRVPSSEAEEQGEWGDPGPAESPLGTEGEEEATSKLSNAAEMDWPECKRLLQSSHDLTEY